ncbi:unnamed protein product, partial [Effrenium voratum]
DLRHDFKLLGRQAEKQMLRDTAFFPALKEGLEPPPLGLPSLRALAACWLDDHQLQRGAHSSVEDARAAMLLYRLLAPQWELFAAKKGLGWPSWTAQLRKQRPKGVSTMR